MRISPLLCLSSRNGAKAQELRPTVWETTVYVDGLGDEVLPRSGDVTQLGCRWWQCDSVDSRRECRSILYRRVSGSYINSVVKKNLWGSISPVTDCESVSDWLRAERPGFDFLQGHEFLCHSTEPTQPSIPPTAGTVPLGQSGWSVKLTTHRHIAPR
jgi:hypothetical protein